jgi:PEP-CTERM motif
MRFKVRHSTLAAIAGLLSAGAANAGNVIYSDDFESGSLSPWTVTGVIADVTEASYGPCCGFTTSNPGNHVAAFGGGRGTGDEVLSQSFADVAGKTYYVSYDWGFIGGSADSLDVTAGGVTHSFCCSGSTDFEAAFMHDTIAFVGTGLDTISFSVHDNPLDSTDTIIDNVKLAVPEPGTWALMIGGFGLAGAALRRRGAEAA